MSDDVLPLEMVERLSGGYKRATDQLRELHERGFWDARIMHGRVVLEQGHFVAVSSGTAGPAPAVRPLSDKRRESPRARTALYRHFDAQGALLYVGIAVNPTKRLSEHMLGSEWIWSIARIEVAWFDTRREAMAAERAAIANESPKFNLLRYTGGNA